MRRNRSCNAGSRTPCRWLGRKTVHMEGRDQEATIYDRKKLLAGNEIVGPAIVVEMDATTVILPGHKGQVDAFGNILIRPIEPGSTS